MEPQTEFDLNQNIQRWRQSLADSPSLAPGNLDELEVHIRDSVNTLEAKGLSTEESFLIAVRRLGQPAALETEFGKVNSEMVWMTRWTWMAIGTFLYVCLQSLRGLANFGMMELAKHFPYNAHVLGFLTSVLTVAIFIAPIVFLPRIAPRSRKLFGKFVVGSIQHHPLLSVAGLVIFNFSFLILSAVGNMFAWRGFTPEQVGLVQNLALWHVWPNIAGMLLLPMLVVYLCRRHLRPASHRPESP